MAQIVVLDGTAIATPEHYRAWGADLASTASRTCAPVPSRHARAGQAERAGLRCVQELALLDIDAPFAIGPIEPAPTAARSTSSPPRRDRPRRVRGALGARRRDARRHPPAPHPRTAPAPPASTAPSPASSCPAGQPHRLRPATRRPSRPRTGRALATAAAARLAALDAPHARPARLRQHPRRERGRARAVPATRVRRAARAPAGARRTDPVVTRPLRLAADRRRARPHVRRAGRRGRARRRHHRRDRGHTVGAGPTPGTSGRVPPGPRPDFTSRSTAPFDDHLALPVDVDPADFDADAVVVVTSHRSVADRAEMHQTLDGELTRTEDTFDVVARPGRRRPQPRRSSTATRSAVRIPTESQSRTPAALQLAQTGVHPIVRRTADRRSARRRGHHVPQPAAVGARAPGPLSVAFVMRQMSLPTIEADGTVTVSDSARRRTRQLRDVLAALDAARRSRGRHATVPRGVLVEPSVLQALGASDAALADELLPVWPQRPDRHAPRLPLDPSAAAARRSAGPVRPPGCSRVRTCSAIAPIDCDRPFGRTGRRPAQPRRRRTAAHARHAHARAALRLLHRTRRQPARVHRHLASWSPSGSTTADRDPGGDRRRLPREPDGAAAPHGRC
jgi:hypothetical protein